MIPNMYKIAGELTPTVFHVAARALAAQGLSIFGDHQRRDGGAGDGFGVARLALGAGRDGHGADRARGDTRIARSVHSFFDGFRTSHEVAKIEQLSLDDMRAMIETSSCERTGRASLESGSSGVARHGAESGRVFPSSGNGQSVLRRLS